MNILVQSVKETYERALAICELKNSDYAEDADPFKNFKAAELVGLKPEQALLLQMTNKLSRIGNLLGGKEAKHEAIEDTLVDLINYSAILKAYIEHGKKEDIVDSS